MNRNLDIECIRIVSMFLIILGHILGGFIPLTVEGSEIFRNVLPKITFFLLFHVNMFILISGYCGIRKIKNAFKVFILVFSYLLLIALFSLLFGWDGFDYRSFLQPLSHNPWWFMRIYFLLALISPILLEPLIKGLNKKDCLILMVIFLFIDIYLGYFCRMETVHYDGYNLLHFVTIYIIGAYLRNFDVKNLSFGKFKLSLLRLFIIFTMIMLVKLLINIGLGILNIKDYFMDYNNPFNILLAVAAFLFFLNLKLKREEILFISTSVIGVYLLSEHPVIKVKLMDFFNYSIGLASENLLLELIVMFLFLFLLFVGAVFVDKMRIYAIHCIILFSHDLKIIKS